MKQDFYEYSRDEEGHYRFTSRGKRTIVKVVGFSSTRNECIFNMWFGDLLPDKTIDDTMISNNGDIRKVLATVVQITREFIFQQSGVTIVFKGNTDQRMILYQRILKRHYVEFSSEFLITGFISNDELHEQAFDHTNDKEYWVFFVRRK